MFAALFCGWREFYTDGENDNIGRAGVCSCRMVRNLINGKNDNIVGQGLAPAVWCGI